MSGTKCRRFDRGQSLLEVTISIGISVIVLTALTIVTISGLKNSQFSQNQEIATKLAQAWMDKVRTVRDRDGMVCNPNVYYHWNALWSNTCNSGSTTCYNFTLNDNTPSCVGTPSSYNPSAPWLLSEPSNYSVPDSQYPQFQKQILIEDFGGDPTQKKVTVTVGWTDLSGAHQSQLVTILTKQ